MTRSKVRLMLRALEPRNLPATFTVIKINDAGAGSLLVCNAKR